MATRLHQLIRLALGAAAALGPVTAAAQGPVRKPNPIPLGPSAPMPAPAPATAGVVPAPSSQPGQLRGVVYDSLAMQPLAGAFVQAVSVADVTKSLAATTDAYGAFRIDSIPAGTWLVGFQHPALDSLSLELAPARVLVRGGDAATVALAVPAGPTLVQRLCNRPTRDATALFLGIARSAVTGAPIPEARVRAQWSTLQVTTSGIRTARPLVTGIAGSEGGVAICGLPERSQISVRAWAAGDSSGVILLDLPPSGILRRDLFIGPATRQRVVVARDSVRRDSLTVTVLHGEGRVRGRVRGATGTPLSGARLQVRGAGGGEVVTAASGTFAIPDLPLGTFTLEARAVGYQPLRLPVDIVRGADAPLELEMLATGTSLDTVKVVTRPDLDERRMQEFERRRKLGFGKFFDEKTVAERNTGFLTDLLRATPGIQVISGQQSGGDQVVMKGTGVQSYCVPALFLNGMQVTDTDGNLDSFVSMSDVRGVEVYTRTTEIPAEFQTTRSCGAIVVWTGGKRRTPPAR